MRITALVMTALIVLALGCVELGCRSATPTEALAYSRENIQRIHASQRADDRLTVTQDKLVAELKKLPTVQGAEVAIERVPLTDNDKRTTTRQFFVVVTLADAAEMSEEQIRNSFAASAAATGLRVRHFWKSHRLGQQCSISGDFSD